MLLMVMLVTVTHIFSCATFINNQRPRANPIGYREAFRRLSAKAKALFQLCGYFDATTCY